MSAPCSDSVDVMHAATTDACVLLNGDPAAATPLAQHIHHLSAHRQGEFVVLDCDAPPDVIEERLDEWFGPSDATDNAPGGTVFLKEIGRLHPRLQRRLVRKLENRRLAPERSPRVIASTGEPLTRRVREGTFNHELFYRLNVIRVVVSSSRRDR